MNTYALLTVLRGVKSSPCSSWRQRLRSSTQSAASLPASPSTEDWRLRGVLSCRTRSRSPPPPTPGSVAVTNWPNLKQTVNQPLIYWLTNKRQTQITDLHLTLLHSASNRLFTTQEREGTCSSEPENQKSSHLVCCVLNKILNLMMCLLTFVKILTHNKEHFLTSCLIFIYFKKIIRSLT